MDARLNHRSPGKSGWGGWILLTAAALLFGGAASGAGTGAPAEAPCLAALSFSPIPRYYGIYFQGNKAGWMSVRLDRPAPDVVELKTITELTLSVSGQASRMKTEEVRRYRTKDGAMISLDYRMGGAAGETEISGVLKEGRFRLATRLGGRETVREAAGAPETICEALPLEAAIRQGRAAVGNRFDSKSFDPSLGRVVRSEETVTRAETRLVAGVEVKVLRVEGSIPDLGLPVSSWYDQRGEMLETILSGFLRARLEDEAQARSGQSQADFLNASVAPVSPPLKHPAAARRMRATLTGVSDQLAVSDGRQTWKAAGEGRRELTVVKETLEGTAALRLADPDRKRLARELEPTARLQSDDPLIAAQAHKLVQDAPGLLEASRTILTWVYENVEKRYTPAFSNASEVLRTRAGDCGEHTVLFVALARAAGIPAREVTGLVYSAAAGGFGYHAWAEVWAGRWISADPSWDQLPADPTHIAFARGELEEQVRLVALIGRLKALAASVEE